MTLRFAIFLILLQTSAAVAGPPYLTPEAFDGLAALCPGIGEARPADGTTDAGLAEWRAGRMRLPEKTRLVRHGDALALALRARGRHCALIAVLVRGRWTRAALLEVRDLSDIAGDEDGARLGHELYMPWEAAALVAGVDAPDAASRRAAAQRIKARVATLLDDDPTGRAAAVRRPLVRFLGALPSCAELAPVMSWILTHEPTR